MPEGRLSLEKALEDAQKVRQLVENQEARDYKIADILVAGEGRLAERGSAEKVPLGPTDWPSRFCRPMPGQSPEKAATLERVRSATLRYEEYTDVNESLYGDVTLGSYGCAQGFLKPEFAEAHLDFIGAEVRNQGVGTRLLRAFAAQMADRGYRHLTAVPISEGGLRTLIGVFGIERSEFYLNTDHSRTFRLTDEELVAVIDSYRDDYNDEPWNSTFLEFKTDLNRFDFSGCERCEEIRPQEG